MVKEETEDDAQMVDLGDSFTAAIRTIVGSDEDKNALLKSEIMQKTEEYERSGWVSNIVEGFIGDKGQKAKQSQQEADIRYTNRQRIQGALHLLCMFVKGISDYMEISLPYPLILTPQGFVIMHGSFLVYSLTLIREKIVAKSMFGFH